MVAFEKLQSFERGMWGDPKYPTAKRVERRADSPRAVILYQLRELATRYGEIPYFWIDLMNWAPADLKPQEVYDLLKNVNPNPVVILNQHIQDGSTLRYFPTDIVYGEVTMPPAAGHQAIRNVGGTNYYLPFDTNRALNGAPTRKAPATSPTSGSPTAQARASSQANRIPLRNWPPKSPKPAGGAHPTSCSPARPTTLASSGRETFGNSPTWPVC